MHPDVSPSDGAFCPMAVNKTTSSQLPSSEQVSRFLNEFFSEVEIQVEHDDNGSMWQASYRAWHELARCSVSYEVKASTSCSLLKRACDPNSETQLNFLREIGINPETMLSNQ